MRSLILLVLAVFASDCVAQSSYLPLPATLTSLERSDAAQLFVVEIRPAFEEPMGYRFEFYAEPRHAVRIIFNREGVVAREPIPHEEAERILMIWRSFDWRQIEDPLEEGEIVMVPDDIGIAIGARFQDSKHEARIGISRSNSVQKLLSDLDILKRK